MLHTIAALFRAHPVTAPIVTGAAVLAASRMLAPESTARTVAMVAGVAGIALGGARATGILSTGRASNMLRGNPSGHEAMVAASERGVAPPLPVAVALESLSDRADVAFGYQTARKKVGTGHTVGVTYRHEPPPPADARALAGAKFARGKTYVAPPNSRPDDPGYWIYYADRKF